MPDSTSTVIGGTVQGAASGAAIGSVVPGIGTAIGGIVGGLAGLIGGIFGASAATRAAQGRARIMREQAQDFVTQGGIGLQRKSMQFNQFYGQAVASAGASGFQKTGSLDTYLGQLATSFKAGQTWDALRIARTAQLQREGADITEDTGQLEAASNILGGVGAAAQGFATAGSALKWWG